MEGAGRYQKRSIQVLEKLREHGPLSTAALQEVLRPEISRRKLQEVTARLVKSGLLYSIDASYSKQGSKVFELRRSLGSRQIIAKKLNIKIEELEYCYVRQWEQRHGEECARWAEFFKRKYPHATVTKDWEIKKDSFLRERVLPSNADRDLYPDIVVSFRDKSLTSKVVFAVEVERSFKKTERLLRKTRSLFLGNQLDGVIFVCAGTGIEESVRRSFLKNNPKSSLRIGAYADYFLMLSQFGESLNRDEILLSNASKKVCSLDQWVHALCSRPAHLRKDTDFIGTGLGAPVFL